MMILEWQAQGTAFELPPEAESPVSSAAKQAESSGRLISAPVRVDERYLTFEIAGSDFEYVTCLNVLHDGVVVRSETGRGSTDPYEVPFDLWPWLGQQIRIEVVDLADPTPGCITASSFAWSATGTPDTAETLRYREPLRPQLHFTARQWTMR